MECLCTSDCLTLVLATIVFIVFTIWVFVDLIKIIIDLFGTNKKD